MHAGNSKHNRNFYLSLYFSQLQLLSQWDFSHGKFGLLFPWESQPQKSRATQPTVHAKYLSVSIIHRTLTWTTGSLTCKQMLMQAIAHEGCADIVTESALKVDSGRKIPCRTGESNLRQRCAGPTLHQLSFPTPKQN